MQDFNDYVNGNNNSNYGGSGGGGYGGGNTQGVGGGFGYNGGSTQGGGGYNGNGQNGGFNQGNLFEKISELSKKFDGKNQNDLLQAIYNETLKGKKNGTLTNADIDRFSSMLSPFLDDKKRKILDKIVRELKKI